MKNEYQAITLIILNFRKDIFHLHLYRIFFALPHLISFRSHFFNNFLLEFLDHVLACIQFLSILMQANKLVEMAGKFLASNSSQDHQLLCNFILFFQKKKKKKKNSFPFTFNIIAWIVSRLNLTIMLFYRTPNKQ